MPNGEVQLSLPQQRGFGETTRPGAWWVQPLAVLLGLSAFVVYGTWAALQGANYVYQGGGAEYLSPFYSPLLFDAPGVETGVSLFGAWPAWWPGWLSLLASPAVFILWAPGGFRLTCYYYRGAYYKAFWADPPSCSVGEPRKGYRGEKTLPLILQNVHRYFLYLALAFIFILGYDAWKAMWFHEEGAEHASFGIGVGTLVLITNVVLLAGYTLGCHSLRHLIGGRKDCVSSNKAQYACYSCVSGLNKRHMLWAWLSLFWVAFSDVYVRLCSLGVWTDWRII